MEGVPAAKAAWRSRTRLRARDRPVGARRGRSQDRRLGEGGRRLSRQAVSARELRARVGANIELSRTRAQNARVLHEAARILESKVAERTEDLLAANERLRNEAIERERVEEQLRQAQKMEAIGQLTGGVAHDFNNLLTGIGGSLQMIKTRMEQGRMDAVDRYVAAAQDAVKRATALTHRLLAFSRRQTLDPKPTNVNRLVAGMEELIRRTVGPAIHLEVVGAGGLWSTLVDPNQLENALLNLCINARDAMPEGGRLTIETANKWLDDRAAKERELMPGQYVSLCVTDNGTGMTPDVVAHAFDPFFTTKPLGAGTGLGLSMIYGFVRQSGGQVRIYTEEGKGTTMCLYLPRHDSDAGAEDPTGMQSQTAAASGDGEIVLVIDDEPTIRKLIAEVLEDEGYTALEVSDGPSGMRVLQSSERIDLLITDVGLPGGMNGRQIADAARGLRPNLKVLFITGYAENAVVGNGHLEKGMQVVAKPFDMDVLARKIRELIES
jgi:signal transduction histidine kinase/CheY-like chemotaxis protein